MKHRTVAAMILVSPMAGALTAQAQSAAAPVPVPRAAFIQTMDGEFGKMDADKDKLLTRAEVEQFQRAVAIAEAQARARAMFNQLDSDRSGQLSFAEFGKMTMSPPPPNPALVMGPSDLNRDGKITLIEYRTAKLANFDRMDADKDGVVSVVEMKAAGLVK